MRHDGPSTLIVTVNAQPERARWVVHLLHYIPTRTSQSIDLLDDIIPLHDVTLTLRVPHAVRHATCEPQGRPLAFEQAAGAVRLTVPRIDGHQLVAMAFDAWSSSEIL